MDIITKAISNVLSDKERMKCPISKTLMLALDEYVKTGHKLSDLPWFKGLNFEAIENSFSSKAAA